METFAIFYMITSAIWLAFIFFRLRDIDYNATENTKLIRRDIVDHDSYARTAASEFALQVSEMEKNLTTEIACLATKNNEDIKRMGGNYVVGDILKFDGIRWCIFGKDILTDGRTRWKLFGENGAEYRIYTDTIPEDIEFIGHRDLSFD